MSWFLPMIGSALLGGVFGNYQQRKQSQFNQAATRDAILASYQYGASEWPLQVARADRAADAEGWMAPDAEVFANLEKLAKAAGIPLTSYDKEQIQRGKLGHNEYTFLKEQDHAARDAKRQSDQWRSDSLWSLGAQSKQWRSDTAWDRADASRDWRANQAWDTALQNRTAKDFSRFSTDLAFGDYKQRLDYATDDWEDREEFSTDLAFGDFQKRSDYSASIWRQNQTFATDEAIRAANAQMVARTEHLQSLGLTPQEIAGGSNPGFATGGAPAIAAGGGAGGAPAGGLGSPSTAGAPRASAPGSAGAGRSGLSLGNVFGTLMRDLDRERKKVEIGASGVQQSELALKTASVMGDLALRSQQLELESTKTGAQVRNFDAQTDLFNTSANVNEALRKEVEARTGKVVAETNLLSERWRIKEAVLNWSTDNYLAYLIRRSHGITPETPAVVSNEEIDRFVSDLQSQMSKKSSHLYREVGGVLGLLDHVNGVLSGAIAVGAGASSVLGIKKIRDVLRGAWEGLRSGKVKVPGMSPKGPMKGFMDSNTGDWYGQGDPAGKQIPRDRRVPGLLDRSTGEFKPSGAGRGARIGGAALRGARGGLLGAGAAAAGAAAFEIAPAAAKWLQSLFGKIPGLHLQATQQAWYE